MTPPPKRHETKVAICYVTDLGFLFPTLLSLQSLRRHVPAEAARVFIFLLDATLEHRAELDAYVGTLGAQLVDLGRKDQFQVDASRWSKTHVPLATLGRFIFEPLLPASCETILYIDGDTLITGPLDELLGVDLPAGMIGAVEDISWFARNDLGQFGNKTRRYFSGIGVDPRHGYFNAGVLLARRHTWRAVAEDGLRFFESAPGRCVFHDQSALNAVASLRRVRLSPKWNFQTPYRHWGVEDEVAPRILHFTEAAKPWMGTLEPWTDVVETLNRLAGPLEALALPVVRLKDAEVERCNRRFLHHRRRLRSLLRFRLFRRRRDIRVLMREAVI